MPFGKPRRAPRAGDCAAFSVQPSNHRLGVSRSKAPERGSVAGAGGRG